MKRILLWMMLLLCLLAFTGCQNSGNPIPTETPAGNDGESENPDSQPTEESQPSQTDQAAGHSLPDYVCAGTYYKLEVTPVVYDVEAIMEYLMPGIDRSRAQSDEWGRYSMEIDNITHTWGSFTVDSGFNNFVYYKNVPDLSRMLTEQEARAYSDDFIMYMGYKVAEDPEFEERENGPCSIYYYFEYEGVPILGNSNYNMGNDEFAQGEYIDVAIDGGGVLRVGMTHLYDVTAVLEEYPDEELISRDQLADIINLKREASIAFSEAWDSGHEYGFRTDEVELIYIPAQENEKWVLQPAFRVRYSTLEDGEVRNEAGVMLIDALSGYVYNQ